MDLATYKIYSTTAELPRDWDSLSYSDIFLQTDYLKVLEEACPKTFCCFYVGVFKEEELVGIALIQRVELYARDMFRSDRVPYFKRIARNIISCVLRGHILVLGNLTHTGQHGYGFDINKISTEDFFKSISLAMNELRQNLKVEKRKRIRLYLLKDYFENDSIHQFDDVLNEKGFIKTTAQPNMILSIDDTWKKPSDYVNAKVKKYRRRYTTARKKLNIQKRELNLEDIQIHSPTLYKLYKNVSDNAQFNTFILPERHFCSLKEHLKERFKLIGYFYKEELIGFYTLIENNQVLETYFLGYDEAHQYQNQLYLNMLFDMAEYAVENKFKQVVYARTAMEIKSSVGAKPYDMIMYLKHTNTILNSIIRQVYNLMNPKRDWEERNPFGNKNPE